MTDVEFLPAAEERRPFRERAIFHGLVFPLCWEDPAVDAEALQISSTDVVLSITSAGCNVLNLLLQNPRSLISVDLNPAQNALLELKIAALRTSDWQTFSDLFAAENPHRIGALYANRFRPLLSTIAARFWDRHLGLMSRNLYLRGRMGSFFRVIRAFLWSRGIGPVELAPFFELPSVDEQRAWYLRRLAPRLWGALGTRLARSRMLLYLSGVHPNQLSTLVAASDLYQVARSRVEHALTVLPIRGNYFWHMAATGRFRPGEVPPYLMEHNFARLRDRADRVRIVYGSLERYLASAGPATIDKFNLRDVFDWMDEPAEEATWRGLARVSTDRGHVLMRSINRARCLPRFASENFGEKAGLSDRFTFSDRSATHGRILLATRQPQVRPPSWPTQSRSNPGQPPNAESHPK